jgi:hypothetical protein
MYWRRTLLLAATLILGVAGGTLLTSNPASAGVFRTYSGTVFADTDGDAVRDPGEAGIANCTVLEELPNDVVLQDTTDANGGFSFNTSNGVSASFTATCTGLIQTTPDPATIPSGGQGDISNIDFGMFDPGQVFGATFNDTDGDGVLDAGETFIDGCTVTLDIGADGSTDSSVQTVDGFAFSNLAAGTVRLRATCPGLAQTTANPADIVVTSGLDQGGILFGFLAPAVPTTTSTTAAVSPTSVLARTGSGDRNQGLGLVGFGLLIAGFGVVTLAARRRTA